MSEIVTANIHVETKPTNRLASVASQAAFWAFLVSAIGVSRIWFGGSFLLELLALIFSMAMLVSVARKYVGREVTMTPEELRRWLIAGAPKNVVEWRRSVEAASTTEG